MAPATRNADDGSSQSACHADDGPSRVRCCADEEPAQAACHVDDSFQQRLAASMKRHRRILDRLAHESG